MFTFGPASRPIDDPLYGSVVALLNSNWGTGNSVRIAGARVTRGSRRYTGAFTPPTAPHPAG